jgi:hypothetical protein
MIQWIDYLDDAFGVYDKRECPGGRFECRGTVKMSSDRRRFLFIPHDKRLSPVEADPA